MRDKSNIFNRKPFEDEYEKFKSPPTAIKSNEGNDLTEISDNELMINAKDELLIRRGNEVKKLSGGATIVQSSPAPRNPVYLPNVTDGVSAYVYIAYASDASGTDFTMTFNAALDYIAILTTDTEIVSPAVGDFTGLWKNYKGAAGANGADGADGQSYYYENLLAYLIETSNPLNPTSRSTITTLATAWRAMLVQDTERLVKDFGAAYFDANFEIWFDFMVTASCQNSSIIYLLMLSNSNDTFTTIYTANGDTLSIFFNQTAGGVLNLGVRECNAGSLTTTQQAISTNTLYYGTWKRDEAVGTYGSLSLYVYSDVLRTNLLWTITVTLTEKQDFQYFTVGAGSGGTGTQQSYGFISNVRIVSA